MVSSPLKNVKVSWDDEIPNIWKVTKFMFQTTNQILCTSNILKPPSEEEIRHIGFPEGKVHTSNFATPWNGRIPAAAKVGQPRTSTKKKAWRNVEHPVLMIHVCRWIMP